MTDSQQRLDSSHVGPPGIDLPSSPREMNAHLDTSHVERGVHPTQFVSPVGETQIPMFHSPDVEMSSPLPETSQYEPMTDLTSDSQSVPAAPSQGLKRGYDEYFDPDDAPASDEDQGESQQTEKSFVSTLSMRHSLQRREAYYEMLYNTGGESWSGFGLLSTDGGHSVLEKEL